MPAMRNRPACWASARNTVLSACLAVTVTDELCSGDDLTDATWSAAAAEWGEEDLIELILLVGNYRMLAGFLNAARVAPDPGLDGFPP